jgi:hypothetical protein
LAVATAKFYNERREKDREMKSKKFSAIVIILLLVATSLCAETIIADTFVLSSTIPFAPLSVRLVADATSEKGTEDVDTIDFKDFSVLNTEYEVESGEYEILYSYNMPKDYVTRSIQLEAFSYGLRLKGTNGSYPIGVAFVDGLGNDLSWPVLTIEPGRFIDETYINFHLKLVNKDRIRLAAGVYSGEVVFTMTAE